MQTSSADYKTAIASTDREIKGYLKFNNTFTLTGEDGLVSFKTTQNAMDAERYCAGSTTSCFCEATFYNEGLAGSGVSLPNSYFDAYIGVTLPDTTVEYVCCGRYYVSEITRGTATTRIVGYDIAGRLSMDYVPTVTPDPDDGYLVMDILNDIIDQTGVNGGTHFTTYGDSTYVAQIFEGNCRAQWGWLCSLVSAKAASYSGTRDPADLGYMKEYYAGNGEANPYAVDETTTYLDGVSFGDEYTITSFTTGTTETPIVIGNGTGVYGLNPYMDNATATTIEGTVNNYQYYPATLHWRGDPCLDIFDEINVTQGVNTYKLIAMKIETTFNGGLEQTINCYGDSANYYALSTSPTQGQINRVSNLVQEIQQAIETADGGVITKILDTDGTWKELVIANNQDLSQATSVWRFNINGLAHSNQYQGGTYTLAMDTQGRIVANVIQTGILQDANGKNSWNLDTGAFTITNGSINITTSSSTADYITLSYGSNYRTTISSYGFSCIDPATNYKSSLTQNLLHIDGTSGVELSLGSSTYSQLDLRNGGTYSGVYAFTQPASQDNSLGEGTYITMTNPKTSKRIRLEPNGITFRNSSNTVTASYLDTGLPMLSASSVGNSNALSGQLIDIGYLGYWDLGIADSATDQQTAEAFLEYVCQHYPNAVYCIFRASIQVGSMRIMECSVYNTANTSGGLPQYAIGTMRQFSGRTVYFDASGYSVSLKVQRDYIAEYGNSNGWYWRKWAGGSIEMWKRLNVSIAVTSSWGNVYYGAVPRQTYPLTLNSSPWEIVSVTGSGGWAWIGCGDYSPSATQSGTYYLFRPSSTTATFNIDFYVRGGL